MFGLTVSKSSSLSVSAAINVSVPKTWFFQLMAPKLKTHLSLKCTQRHMEIYQQVFRKVVSTFGKALIRRLTRSAMASRPNQIKPRKQFKAKELIKASLRQLLWKKLLKIHKLYKQKLLERQKIWVKDYLMKSKIWFLELLHLKTTASGMPLNVFAVSQHWESWCQTQI